MKETLVVFNYNAGRKKAVLTKKQLQKFLLTKTNKFKFVSIEEFDEIDIKEYDVIMAVGGDGTVNKLAKCIANTDKTLAIIPTGTANLLAAKLGFSTNLKKTLNILNNEKKVKIDLLDINERPCVLRLGIGYDADIICKTPQSLKNKFGYFAYFIAGIIFAIRLKQKNYELKYDDKTINVNATCIIIANTGNMYHDTVSVCENSDLSDGKFEVFILKAKNPITFFYEFLRILLGIKKNNSRAIYLHASNLKIKNNWCACHIDGEKSKLKNDINIQVKKNVVNVYCD